MTRLPTPGSDNGAWGTILNDFLSVEHNSDGTLKSASTIAGAIQSSTVTAKGDIIVATAASTVTRLGAGSNGQVLIADSTQSAGTRWATPATVGDVYPLAAYGFHSATGSINHFTGNGTIGEAWFARIFVPAGKAINAIAAVVRNAGTVGAGGLNSFAIYDDSGTFISSTANDDTQWQSTGWIVKTLASPIAAQSSDRFVYAAISCRGYSAVPNIMFNVTTTELGEGGGYLVNNRRVFLNGISAWPASINPATYGSSTTGYLPLIALG